MARFRIALPVCLPIDSTNFVETVQSDITNIEGLAPPSKLPSTVFGRRLREARLRAGIPQDRLGVEVGLDEATASTRISRYETGVHEPPFDTAVQLARALGVPTPYLYCEDDELAAVLLGWARLSKSDKKRIRMVVDEARTALDR